MQATKRSQSGLTTLLVSAIILFLATILVIAVSRTLLLEQRMSGNETRHREAFEAAQAGLDRALQFLQTAPAGAVKDNTLNVPSLLSSDTNTTWSVVTDWNNNPSTFAVAFCEPGVTPAINACPSIVAGTPVAPVCNTAVTEPNFNTPLVVACGWSDDGIASVYMQQGVGTVPPIGNTQTNPVISRGAMNVGGSANVVNYFNNLTVWSGGPLTSIGNAGKTFIRNPNVGPPPAGTVPPGEPNSCATSADYICVTDKNNTGPDVIASDPTLSSLSPEDFFKNFTGYESFSDYQTKAASMVIPSSDVGDLVGVKGQTIAITGNTTFPNGTIGSRERPVVIIVNGNVEFQGSPTIYGIVYVMGNVEGGGTPTIQGAMTIQGDIAPTGSVDIIYDPFITGGAQERIGLPGFIPGTWRDWR